MKKILTVALLCAVSSFAAWDKFPIKPAGKGEAKIGIDYNMPAEKLSELDINFKARFSVIEGLEVAAMLAPGFRVMSSYDGNDTEETGLMQPVLGVRYWLPMGVGIFLDVGLPVSGEKFEDDTFLSFSPGVQYSTKINEQLSIGTEVGLLIHMAGERDVGGAAKVDVNPGMFLGFGLEVDYSLGMVTPFLGADFAMGLTKPQVDGKDFGDANGLGIWPYAGAIIEINEMIAVDLGVSLGFGEDWVYKDKNGDDELPVTISANLSVNF